MEMDNLMSLVFGVLVGIGGFIFVIHHSYKHLRKGKIQSIYIFAHAVYSFKKEPLKAVLCLIFNFIIALLCLITGIMFILSYFHINWLTYLK